MDVRICGNCGAVYARAGRNFLVCPACRARAPWQVDSVVTERELSDALKSRKSDS